MNAVVEKVQEFFNAILAIVESFFGFIRALLPTTTTAPAEPETKK